jgi:hypothetical protein
VKDCDGALLFGDITAPGGRGFIRDCRELGKPCGHVEAGLTTPRHIAGFIRESGVSRLMIAGNREREPAMGERAKRFLIVVFKLLGTTPCPTADAGLCVAFGPTDASLHHPRPATPPERSWSV